MEINAPDTAFMLVATALVLIMTPGLAFFYGGLVGRKNVVTIMMQSFVSLGITTVLWVTVGFSLCFGSDIGGIIGSPFDFFLMMGIAAGDVYEGLGIPVSDADTGNDLAKMAGVAQILCAWIAVERILADVAPSRRIISPSVAPEETDDDCNSCGLCSQEVGQT